MSDSIALAIKPIVRYPRVAQVGKTYLITIDLEVELGTEWNYEEEEYPIYCEVDSNSFSLKPVGEPVIVLHRFGGNYGEARFLIQLLPDMASEINIAIKFINKWGTSIKVIRLENLIRSEINKIYTSKEELYSEEELSSLFPSKNLLSTGKSEDETPIIAISQLNHSIYVWKDEFYSEEDLLSLLPITSLSQIEGIEEELSIDTINKFCGFDWSILDKLSADRVLIWINKYAKSKKTNELTDLECQVFRECWNFRTYNMISNNLCLDPDYVREIGASLFKRLSRICGEPVSKRDFKIIIKRLITSINIADFFRATNPNKSLQAGDVQDDRYYVDFSSVRGERLIEQLRRKITYLSPDVQTCSLFTGHIGCGKSTELLQLQKLLETDGFHVVYFESSDDLEMTDVDIGDLMLAIAKRISKSLEDVKINVKGGKLRSLLAKTKDVLLTPIDANVINSGLREKLNQFLAPQKNKLVEAINEELIMPAIKQLKQQGKKGLAVIVDNLDRLDSRVRPDGKSQHEYLFIDQSECLTKLACHLVYTFPLSMRYGNEPRKLMQRYNSLMVLPMVPPIDQYGNSYDARMVLLRQMVLRRAIPEGTDEERITRLGDFFESEDVIDRLCRISGGNNRDLMRLLNSWIKKEQQLPLRADTLEQVIRERRNEMVVVISDDEWELLRQVQKRKMVSGNGEYQFLISSRWMFEYQQGAESWFAVNPILLEAAEMQSFINNQAIDPTLEVFYEEGSL
jgi:hypothetical protein